MTSRLITSEDVIISIESVLGRTPDQALVNYHLSLGFSSTIELGRYLRSTQEFKDNIANVSSKPPLFLGDRIMAHTHRGEVIYLAPTDRDITPNVLIRGVHEPHVEQAIAAAVRPGDTVIDIGCNIGYHTLAMAAGIGQNGKLYAFEANPLIANLLHASLYVNGYTDFRGHGRVELSNVAVSDVPGSLILQYAPDHFGSGHLITDSPSADFGAEYSNRVEVKTVNLDNVLNQDVVVDFIHMDIEGAEPLAIRGASKLLDRSPDVKIITEWSPHMMNTLSDPRAYVDSLIARGFGFWLLEGYSYTEMQPNSLFNVGHGDLFISRSAP